MRPQNLGGLVVGEPGVTERSPKPSKIWAWQAAGVDSLQVANVEGSADLSPLAVQTGLVHRIGGRERANRCR
jgi:hypothetical protein